MTIGKKMLGVNGVEFDFTMGHVLVIFPFLWIENEKCKETHASLPCPPGGELCMVKKIMIYLLKYNFNGYILTHHIPPKLYKITIFHTGSLYLQLRLRKENSLHTTLHISKTIWPIFLKFSDSVPNILLLLKLNNKL